MAKPYRDRNRGSASLITARKPQPHHQNWIQSHANDTRLHMIVQSRKCKTKRFDELPMSEAQNCILREPQSLEPAEVVERPAECNSAAQHFP